MSGLSHIPVLAFSIEKIVTLEQLYQQLIKLVISICFCFFGCKNHNVRADILTTGQAGCTYASNLSS